MTIIIKNKIEKGTIKLPEKAYLPDGTQVIAKIEPVLEVQEKKRVISELSGAWSDDPSIMIIFKEIEEKRHEYFGRGVGLE